MTYEPRDRPRSIFARMRNLLHGMFSIWMRESEVQNPRAVYEQAINEKTKQYHQLKEAVAGILYMRNTLQAEISERRAEIARLHDDVRRSVRRNRDDLSVVLIAQKQERMEELERAMGGEDEEGERHDDD